MIRFWVQWLRLGWSYWRLAQELERAAALANLLAWTQGEQLSIGDEVEDWLAEQNEEAA